MHKLLILLTTLIGLFQTVSAQYSDNNVLGLKVGVGISSESTRQCLKEKLSGRPEVGVGGTIGYEFPIGITVSGDYLYTVTDLVATSVNAYGWTEQENRAHTVRVMVGYAIGLDGK